MKTSVLSACCCVLLLVALGSSLPVAEPRETVLIELVPQETLHTLDLGEPKSDLGASREKRTIGFLRETFPTLSEAPEADAKSRVVRAAEDAPAATNDQETAANDETENRDKRFLFGFGRSEGGSGSAAGSGNFLFDIIRLIAGSGTTEEAAEVDHGTSGGAVGVGYSAGAAAIETPELDGKPDDGYTSGIPGPITRLFVIANRGISNLIQDLILRLAQTSERVVNFKARLITSII